jgi:formiminoglutamate deiminase
VASYHCQYAWVGNGGDVAADVLVVVDDGRIVSVQEGVPAPAGSVRLEGITIPGLANAHSHAFHRALRGRTHGGVGSFWTWRDEMYRLASALDPDTLFALARAVYGEMVLAGITCVGEFHYVHHDPSGRPYSDPNVMTASLLAAAAEVGIRITVLDTCYLRGDIGLEPNSVQRRFCDDDASAWAARVTAARTLQSSSALVAAAVHSVRAVDPDDIEVVTAWASATGSVVHAHVSEQPAENHRCIEAYALTPTELLAERGLLSQRFTAVHATHVTEHDVHLLGASGSTVCLCPTTERDLADGIGPSSRLVEAGAPLVLGSDSHAVIDLFEEARAVELDERLASRVRGNHTTRSLLGAATLEGHRCLGWPDAGSIVAGSRADLVTIALGSVRMAGAAESSLLDSVLFAAAAADVDHVVIDGTVVVEGGRHVAFDVADALGTSIRSAWNGR